MTDWRESVSPYLTPMLRKALADLPEGAVTGATELRIRAEGAAKLHTGQAALPLGITSAADVQMMVEAMLGHARHARQTELRQGFVTLTGGLRAGLSGQVALRDGAIQTLRDIGSVTIRIARAVPGAADALMPYLIEEGRPVSALLISPPGAGKTTMLRDAARQLSDGGFVITVVDERSELAACQRGVPQLAVGANTDVLDGCPKAEGMMLALRAMSPEILVTDELGSSDDAEAVAEAARCGVAVIATAHGRDVSDICARPQMAGLLRARAFALFVALAPIGRIVSITDTEGNALGEVDVRGAGRARAGVVGPVLCGGAFTKGGSACRVGTGIGENGGWADPSGSFA